MLQWLKNVTAPKLDAATTTTAELVGTLATVVRNSLTADKLGQVKCQAGGALAKAKLVGGPVSELAEGAIVMITGIEGDVLTVAPRQL